MWAALPSAGFLESVLARNSLSVIDNQNFGERFRRFQLECQLLLHSREDIHPTIGPSGLTRQRGSPDAYVILIRLLNPPHTMGTPQRLQKAVEPWRRGAERARRCCRVGPIQNTIMASKRVQHQSHCLTRSYEKE